MRASAGSFCGFPASYQCKKTFWRVYRDYSNQSSRNESVWLDGLLLAGSGSNAVRNSWRESLSPMADGQEYGRRRYRVS